MIRVRVAGEERWAAIEDAGRLRDALGTALPVGVPEAFLEPVPDPLGDLVARYARTHGPFTPPTVAAWFGLGPAVVTDALRRLVAAGRVVEGELLPDRDRRRRHGLEFCDAEVLRTLRRRSLAALRARGRAGAGRRPGPLPAALAGRRRRAARRRGLLRAVEQLAGAVVPASALETLVLPAGSPATRPALLDELMRQRRGRSGAGTARCPATTAGSSLHLADTAHLTLPRPDRRRASTETHRAVLDALAGGGAYFFRTARRRRVGGTDDHALIAALWDLVWAGPRHQRHPRAAAGPARRWPHRPPARTPRARGRTRYAGGAARSAASARGSVPAAAGQAAGRAAALPARPGRPPAAGRWSLLPAGRDRRRRCAPTPPPRCCSTATAS